MDGPVQSALVLEIIQGKTTVAEASRQFDLTPSEIESWVDDAGRHAPRKYCEPRKALMFPPRIQRPEHVPTEPKNADGTTR